MGKELPKNWVETDLFKLADIYTGKKDANFASEQGEYNFFTCAFKPLRADTYSFEGDVLILPGNGVNVGEVFFFSGKFEAYQRTYIVNDIKISSEYLYYHFKRYWKEIGSLKQYGSATNYIKIGNFKEYNVQFPSLTEQERIVAKLASLFKRLDKIKVSLAKIPKLLQNFRQQVLTQAVTGRLTEEWREGKDLGEWMEETINNVIINIKAGKNFNCPGQPVSGNNVGLVKISAVTWGSFDEKETKTVLDEKKINPELFIKKGDFLISRANTIELVGSCLIVGSIQYKIMLSDKIWRVNFYEEWTKRFINFYLKSNLGRKEIQSRASGNQHSMRNLSQKEFKNITFLKPGLNEQKEIVNLVESLFIKADKIQEKYEFLKATIEKLPQTILHKAFKGELVPQLESDGDARDLLREIEELKSQANSKHKKAKNKNYKIEKGTLYQAAENSSRYKNQ